MSRMTNRETEQYLKLVSNTNAAGNASLWVYFSTVACGSR
jgi:hypothetical protein